MKNFASNDGILVIIGTGTVCTGNVGTLGFQPTSWALQLFFIHTASICVQDPQSTRLFGFFFL